MISKEALKRGYNRGRYTVGAPTTPGWATEAPVAGESSQQVDPVDVPAGVIAQLESAADEVLTSPGEVIAGTRDWWARTMIAETSGNPATPAGVIVKVSTVAQVQQIVRIAAQQQIPITVSAGRSNVTGAAWPLRGGIVLDLCGLNNFISFDAESQLVEVEAGIFGDVFEELIQSRYAMTTGHWPSSYGLSTVGGWVTCRGAGQLSTRYGKIEDMVYGLDVVLPNGEEVTLGNSARAAVGPALDELFIGSEGTLGIVVRVRLKLHRLPDHGRAIAYAFTDFPAGLEACRQIMQHGADPAVLRLYDNLESGVQFNEPDRSVLLIADEGPQWRVDAVLGECARRCSEIGEEIDGDAIFERWLDSRFLTGKSAEGFKASPGFVADTLEMVGPWSKLPAVYRDVISALNEVPGTLAGSAHQSHAYVDSGCLYFSLRGEVAPDQRHHWYRQAWDAANAVLIKHQVTLSHHHGVGMLRSPYLQQSLGGGFEVLRAVKKAIDPDNLFNPGKLGLD